MRLVASMRISPKHVWAIVILALLLWGWFDVRGRALPESGRAGQMTDLTVYLTAARALRAGQDIYEVRNARNWPYLYPPLVAVLFVPLADLSRAAAAYVWFLVSAAALAASLLLMRATLRHVQPRWATAACLMGLLGVALPALHTLQRSQVNHVVLLCVCLATWALSRRWDILAGASLAMAAALKVTPGFALVYLLFKWFQQQGRLARAGRWTPRQAFAGAGATFGFVLGLALGAFVPPALLVGPHRAIGMLASWRAHVAGGYGSPDAAGDLFGDTRGIHDTNDKNQTWYRAAIAYMVLADPDALEGRDRLRPDRQELLWWILAGVAGALTVSLLGMARSDWTDRSSPAAYAELAAFVWLGISLGKIAWGHFYVVTYPLWAVAWLLGRSDPDDSTGRWMRTVFWGVLAAWLLHYAVLAAVGLGRYGTMLLPAGLLAFATVWAANRCRAGRQPDAAAVARAGAIGQRRVEASRDH